MKMKYFFWTLLGAIILWSCTKPGPGGRASIEVEVKASRLTAPNASVFLKYDATTAGSSDGDYDVQKVSNALGLVYFTNLHKGDYYIFATGIDTATMADVSAGMAVEITDRKQVVEQLLEME